MFKNIWKKIEKFSYDFIQSFKPHKFEVLGPDQVTTQAFTQNSGEWSVRSSRPWACVKKARNQCRFEREKNTGLQRLGVKFHEYCKEGTFSCRFEKEPGFLARPKHVAGK